jgi:hypothetical protein
MKRISGTVAYKDGQRVDVSGYLLKIEGFDSDFIIHKHPFHNHITEGQWCVTERETGLGLPINQAFTRVDAEQYARKLLDPIGPIKFKEILEANKVHLNKNKK